MPVANSLMTPAGRHQLILAIADGASYCDSSSMYGGSDLHHQMVWKIVKTARALTRPRTPRRLLMVPMSHSSRCRGLGSALGRFHTMGTGWTHAGISAEARATAQARLNWMGRDNARMAQTAYVVED